MISKSHLIVRKVININVRYILFSQKLYEN